MTEIPFAAVEQLVGAIDDLPTVPRVYQALISALASPKADITTVAAIVESDPAIAIKVLHLVNSAFFGLSRRTASIHQAVSFLGVEVLKACVLTAHVFDVPRHRVTGMSIETFQAYSLGVGRLARNFVTDPAVKDEAFTAGILHDVGKLVLATNAPARFANVLRAVAHDDRPQYEIECELLGVSHAHVGAYLLRAWGCPILSSTPSRPTTLRAPRGRRRPQCSPRSMPPIP